MSIKLSSPIFEVVQSNTFILDVAILIGTTALDLACAVFHCKLIGSSFVDVFGCLF